LKGTNREIPESTTDEKASAAAANILQETAGKLQSCSFQEPFSNLFLDCIVKFCFASMIQGGFFVVNTEDQ
jgi:hypothetical protein